MGNIISERNLSSIDGNDSTAASDQTTRVRLQSPQEENKQPAARRSSKNAIYEPLSILKKKRFKPYLTPLLFINLIFFSKFLEDEHTCSQKPKKYFSLFEEDNMNYLHDYYDL